VHNCNILYNMRHILGQSFTVTVITVFSMADCPGTFKRPFMSFLLVFVGSLVPVDFHILRSAAQSRYKTSLVIILLREKLLNAFEHCISACIRNDEYFLFSVIFRLFKCVPII